MECGSHDLLHGLYFESVRLQENRILQQQICDTNVYIIEKEGEVQHHFNHKSHQKSKMLRLILNTEGVSAGAGPDGSSVPLGRISKVFCFLLLIILSSCSG